MKKITRTLYSIGLMCLLATFVAEAGKPIDGDGDGVLSNRDCDDSDETIWDLNSCGLCAPEPSEGCGITCTDNDLDGYAQEGGSCGPVDCDDTDGSIFPGPAVRQHNPRHVDLGRLPLGLSRLPQRRTGWQSVC